jgi:hypothetical protein
MAEVNASRKRMAKGFGRGSRQVDAIQVKSRQIDAIQG